jgi:hypothetical protein
LLKKIESVVASVLGYNRPESASVHQVTGLSPRDRVSIRATLVELGLPTSPFRWSQPLLYRELNRSGQRVWRAA